MTGNEAWIIFATAISVVGVGIALLLSGIGIFGAVMANFAASLQGDNWETTSLIEEAEALRAEVANLRK